MGGSNSNGRSLKFCSTVFAAIGFDRVDGSKAQHSSEHETVVLVSGFHDHQCRYHPVTIFSDHHARSQFATIIYRHHDNDHYLLEQENAAQP